MTPKSDMGVLLPQTEHKKADAFCEAAQKLADGAQFKVNPNSLPDSTRHTIEAALNDRPGALAAHSLASAYSGLAEFIEAILPYKPRAEAKAAAVFRQMHEQMQKKLADSCKPETSPATLSYPVKLVSLKAK